MRLATQEAKRSNREYIGPEHILLALVRESNCVATHVLMKLGVDLLLVGLEVERHAGTGFGVTARKLNQTPRAKKVIEYSMEEARNLNHDYIGSEHVLLGLLRDPEGIATRVLVNFGVTADRVRLETLNFLGSPTNNADIPASGQTDICYSTGSLLARLPRWIILNKRILILVIVAVCAVFTLVQLWAWTAQFPWSSDPWLMTIPLAVVFAGVCSLGALVVLRLTRRKRKKIN